MRTPQRKKRRIHPTAEGSEGFGAPQHPRLCAFLPSWHPTQHPLPPPFLQRQGPPNFLLETWRQSDEISVEMAHPAQAKRRVPEPSRAHHPSVCWTPSHGLRDTKQDIVVPWAQRQHRDSSTGFQQDSRAAQDPILCPNSLIFCLALALHFQCPLRMPPSKQPCLVHPPVPKAKGQRPHTSHLPRGSRARPLPLPGTRPPVWQDHRSAQSCHLLPPLSCVAWSSRLHFSEARFPHLEDGELCLPGGTWAWVSKTHRVSSLGLETSRTLREGGLLSSPLF